MSNTEDSGRRRPGRPSGFGAWLFVLAGLATAIGFAITTGDDPGAQPAEKDRPVAQTARDDYSSPVWSLAFSPDDTRLASATISGDVWLKSLTGDRLIRVRQGTILSARSLAYSPDGRALAVSGVGSVVRLLDAASGEELKPLTAVGKQDILYVAFSRDGTRLAAGGSGGTLTLWEWDSRRLLAVLGGHRRPINSLAFSPDGSVLASGDLAGLVKLWDVATGNERTTFRAHEAGNGVTAVAFSPDGALLVTGSYPERAVRLWDPARGEGRGSLPTTDSGPHALAFSPDGVLLAIARGDGTAVLWGVAEARELGSVRADAGGLQSVAFSGDGRVLATGGADGCVRLWDVAQALSRGPRGGRD
jgi:WD40 repeat protein